MLRTERQDDGVIVGRRLQLEIEAFAETFAQRETQTAVDAPAKGSMHHQLHAASLVKESFEHDPIMSGHGLQRRVTRREICDDETSSGTRNPGDAPEIGARGIEIVGSEMVGKGLTQPRDLVRELSGSSRCFTEPERDGRRRPCSVDDAHRAAVDLGNSPRGRTQQEHIAGHRFDRPVFTHRPDVSFFVVSDHPPVA